MQTLSANDAKARFGSYRIRPGVSRGHRTPWPHRAVVISEEEYEELGTIKLQHLRAEIELGIAGLERGSLADCGTDGLAQLGGRIRATGRKRFSGKRAVVAQPAT